MKTSIAVAGVKLLLAVAAFINTTKSGNICLAFQERAFLPSRETKPTSGSGHACRIGAVTSQNDVFNVHKCPRTSATSARILWSAPPKASSSVTTFAPDADREPSLTPNELFPPTQPHVPPSHHANGDTATGPSRSGRTINEIRKELASGRSLTATSGVDNGVNVVDFASVKNNDSKAERALSKARKEYFELRKDMKVETTNDGYDTHNLDVPLRKRPTEDQQNILSQETAQNALPKVSLMGINDDVVSEVGHPIGAFVQNDTDVQDCAAWLRSTAVSKGTRFSSSAADATSDARLVKTELRTKFQKMLHQAYEESGEVTAAFAKTFYLGTQLMDEKTKRAIWAIYVWCRRTDEIVDAPRDSNEEMLQDLSEWEVRLERLWEYGEVVDVLDLPLLDVRIQYPNLPIQPFLDMVRGMLMDIPGLGQDRYDTFDELHLYCYRVAGTVGLMSMPIFGCAHGHTEEEAKEPALSLGVAFQLTNILRDVGEDAGRGRIYLPQEDLVRFDVTEDQIFEKRMDDNYRQLMKFEIERARQYYDRALRGVPMLAEGSRWPVQSSLDAYGRILDKIEANDYDSLNQRAYVSKLEKLGILPLSWYKTLPIAKYFPLPGERAL